MLEVVRRDVQPCEKEDLILLELYQLGFSCYLPRNTHLIPCTDGGQMEWNHTPRTNGHVTHRARAGMPGQFTGNMKGMLEPCLTPHIPYRGKYTTGWGHGQRTWLWEQITSLTWHLEVAGYIASSVRKPRDPVWQLEVSPSHKPPALPLQA